MIRRFAVEAAIVAASLVAPYGAAFAEDAPPIEPPVAEPPIVEEPVVEPPLVEPPVVEPPVVDPSVEPPWVPGSPEDLPPLESEMPKEQESLTPEGDHDWGPTPPPIEPPPTGIWAMSDADRIAYLTAKGKAELELGLQQWAAQFLASREGSASGPTSRETAAEAAAVVSATLAATGGGEPWIQLSKTIVDRQLARPSGTQLEGRALSSRPSVRYETPRTTEVAFVIVNGSPIDATVAVTWQSGSEVVGDRIRVAAGATVHSVLVLPERQSGEPGVVTAGFTSPGKSRDEISFVALASPVLPQGIPEARGFVAPPR